MVSLVTGEGLGLYNSSLNVLGSATGNAQLGRFGNQVHVNTATGNLVVRQRDEFVASQGADLALFRSYNALGQWDGDNNDNWQLSVHRRVHDLTGTANTAGSTVQKTFGDGLVATYTYNVDQGIYVSTEGDGAHDTLTYDNGTWRWNDGDADYTEQYNADGQGDWRLSRTQDINGNGQIYLYNASGQVNAIQSDDGQLTSLTWNGTQLSEISVTSDGQTTTRTSYDYDPSGRLSTVTVISALPIITLILLTTPTMVALTGLPVLPTVKAKGPRPPR